MSYKGLNAKTPRRNEWYWGPIVKSQQLSGLSQKKFCEQEGISYASFKNWSSRLKQGSAELQELDMAFTALDLRNNNMSNSNVQEILKLSKENNTLKALLLGEETHNNSLQPLNDFRTDNKK